MSIRRDDLHKKFIKYLESIQPNQEIISLFNAIVRDVWKDQQEENRKAKQRLKKSLQELKDKRTKIFNLMLDEKVEKELCQEKLGEVKQEIIIKNIELNETNLELDDAESCLNYCQFFLSNIARLWSDAPIDLRQRFQNLIFPEGITFDGKVFRTPKMSNVFSYLQPETLPQSPLAAPRGFEPLSDG